MEESLAGLSEAAGIDLLRHGKTRLLVNSRSGRAAVEIPAASIMLEDGEIEQAEGPYGTFAPYSWWPLWLSLAGSLVFLGVAVGLWVSAFGALVGVWALCGWVFEYYKGEHAH